MQVSKCKHFSLEMPRYSRVTKTLHSSLEMVSRRLQNKSLASAYIGFYVSHFTAEGHYMDLGLVLRPLQHTTSGIKICQGITLSTKIGENLETEYFDLGQTVHMSRWSK